MRVPEFNEYLIDQAVAGLQKVPEGDRSNVYVVSFFVYDEDDDPRSQLRRSGIGPT